MSRSPLAKQRIAIETAFPDWFSDIVMHNLSISYNPGICFDLTDKINTLPFPKNYKNILGEVVSFVMMNIDNIGLLVITGGCGRMDIIEGVSDIDLFFVLKEEFHLEYLMNLVAPFRFLRWIKVGFTFISDKDFSQKNTTRSRIHYIIKNFHYLSSLILVKNQIYIPEYSKELLMKSVSLEFDAYLKKFWKIVENVVDEISYRKWLKKVYTAMKMLLLVEWHDTIEWYDAVRRAFYKIFQIDGFPRIPRYQYKKKINIEKEKSNLFSCLERIRMKAVW